MTYEDKAIELIEKEEAGTAAEAQLLGMAYVADAITKGFRRLAKVIDNMSLEVQDDADFEDLS